MTITVEKLNKSYRSEREDVKALDDLSLTIQGEKFFTLLGPSGCGKTTLMRCIAGLETPTMGKIRISDRIVYSSGDGIDVPVNRRRIGMVFQSYAIWPHMTVFQNVAFPLEVQKKPDIDKKVRQALEMVELAHLSDRYASRLSGGQQQRVAFARAVVGEPSVLLLDEPLSNLDAALREVMRSEMRRLQRRLKLTTVYVTHDQSEALSMSDTIAVMKDGRLVEVASPENLYNNPKRRFTALFIGGANLLSGKVAQHNGDGIVAETAIGLVRSLDNAPAGQTSLFFRPEKIELIDAAAPKRENEFTATIANAAFVGENREIELRLNGLPEPIRCRIRSDYEPQVGEALRFRISPNDVHVLAGE